MLVKIGMTGITPFIIVDGTMNYMFVTTHTRARAVMPVDEYIMELIMTHKNGGVGEHAFLCSLCWRHFQAQ